MSSGPYSEVLDRYRQGCDAAREQLETLTSERRWLLETLLSKLADLRFRQNLSLAATGEDITQVATATRASMLPLSAAVREAEARFDVEVNQRSFITVCCAHT